MIENNYYLGGERMDHKTDIIKGLTSAEVKQRFECGENNGNFDVRTKSVRQIIKDNIFTLFNLLNVILALFVALTGSYRNMLFMGVVISNAAIGVIQELRSKRIIDRLSLISAPKAHVIRDGTEQECAVGDIVKDDILILSGGRQICADCVVVDGTCEVDESLLTGESDPITKTVGDELLSGSYVISGSIKAQAVKVGADSYANTVTSGAKYIKKQNSELMRCIDKIIRTISVFIVPFALVLFFKAIFVTNQDFNRGVVSTVAAIIGMIPEGLVLLTSSALAVSSVRLARRNTLCQDLYCVEHLARVDVLCLDKTGTITEGDLELTELIPLDDSFDSAEALGAFCSFMTDVNHTLSAIKEKYNSRPDWKCTQVIPFSSAKKWSAVVFEEKGAYILGAPNFILSQSDHADIGSLVERYTSDGMRVLLLAHSSDSTCDDTIPADISAKALLVMSDKIRATAQSTLSFFRQQGVTLKVISGDDPVTVASVAKRAGLDGWDRYVDASKLSDEQLCGCAEDYTVFGRVTPQQKLQLIKALKSNCHRVAMTGDGVNDVLALKEADCSIAMQSGSDAARNVSQLVLLDSDFASLPLVVEEGRRVINNIQRSAALFLVKTVFSFLLAMLFLVVPFAYPFRPIQMTLISALSIGVPSFLLALQTNRNRVEGSFISSVLQKALPGGVSVALGITMLVVAQGVLSLPQEQVSVIATYLTAVVCFSILCGVCRPFNKRKAAMLLAMIVSFVVAVLVFPEVFYIVPLSAECWAVFGVIICVVMLSMFLLSTASQRLFKHDKEPSLPARFRRMLVAAVFALSALFAVWFGTLMADYFAIAGGKSPVVAHEEADGSYKGLLYSIYDGEIHILGNDIEPIDIDDDMSFVSE